jgi:RNA polymerase sigma-70 factor (ECF subfamily)
MKKVIAANRLLEQACRGDQEALGQLLETQRAALRRLAERQLEGRIGVHAGASDVTQQTFVEAHRSFPQFAGQDVRDLAAWLQSILEHRVADAVRDHALLQKRDGRRDRSMDDSHGEVASFDLDRSPKAIGEERLSLSEALTLLPDAQREAVQLRHLEGWALADIARHLGRTRDATASLIKRGMKTLRHQLRQDD